MRSAVSTEKSGRPPTKRGGWRPFAGRKRAKETRYDPSHAARPELSYKHGVHVMLRTRWGVPRLRQRVGYEALRRVLLFCLEHDSFRIVHISIQKNHIHMVVEAGDKQALRRGMQRFAIRAAKALNVAFEREGKVFQFRYDAKQIKTKRYARNVISYVLNNWRRHREDWYEGEQDTLFDPFSSAATFSGWTENHVARVAEGFTPLPVSQPRTGLLRSEWQWFGLVDPWEIPGPLA